MPYHNMADKNHRPSMNWEATDLPKEFSRFRQHCDFTFRGPLAAKSEVERVNYLMTFIGDKGRELYTTFTFAPATEDDPAESDTLEGVYAKYAAYVQPKKNQIRAAVNFHRRKQGPTERFDNFVTDLRLLVKDCGYSDEDRMIRDAIVLNAQSTTVREKCLDKGDELTLDVAIRIGQSHEMSQDSLKVIGTDEDAKVQAVHKRRGRYQKRNNAGARPKESQPKGNTASGDQCYKCGNPRSHAKCPASESICGKCNKKGHWAKVCRNTKSAKQGRGAHAVAAQDPELDDDDYADMHLVSAVGDNKAENDSDWWETVEIEGHDLHCQIDTGAAESLLPYKTFAKMNCRPRLKQTARRFQSYTKHPIKVEGSVVLQTCHKNNVTDIKFYVVHIDQNPLISGADSVNLGLISRIHVAKELDSYPELQQTTAMLPGTYTLKIDPSVPPVVHGPRRQPQALRDKINAKLDEMVKDGHITKVTEPTDWVSSMVTVVKAEKVRICLDPKDLNKAIKREHYPIPTVEEVVASFPGAQVWSVLDAKSGFLQIQLDHESSLLTTFNTPQGRYRWLRLPFGVKSAPEIFQRIMDTMLEDIPGARAVMDDILIGARDEKEHDRILEQVLRRATEYNLRFNFKKCHIRKPRVPYCGHVITADGLEADPQKVRAVREMPVPESKEDIRRFLGLVQYLDKFLDDRSTVDAPLRDVLRQDVDFYWLEAQQTSLDKIKELCCKAPVLARFDPAKEATIQCDASSYGLGAALLQEGRPVAYTSRALTQTEQRYAQIEKETLAIVHACKRFHFYVFGRPVTVQSDHKPLQAIFTKPLLAAPMRLQSMMLRLQPYDLTVTYVPGKDIPIGDALSRANLPDEEPDIEPQLINVVDHIAIAPARYKKFQEATAHELYELQQIIKKGWPDTKAETPHSTREYWNFRDELSLADGLILKGMKIVVPPSMHSEMLAQIHESHMGITKCKQRGCEALFWPGMTQAIHDMVSDCPECEAHQNRQASESLRPTPTPELPWNMVGTDIFDWKGNHYLLTVDYFSRYIEVDQLRDMSSSTTIETLKTQLCRHGIPEVLRSDNGPQFSSHEFAKFAQSYGMQHITSSPAYPQSNGEAERAVQTVKRLWTKCPDRQLALLDYRSTPLESCQLSPAQLSMGRRLRTKLPIAKAQLQPAAYDLAEVRNRLDANKAKQKQYHDTRAAGDLHVLLPGDPVRMQVPETNDWLPATVVEHHESPRSYIVECNGRKYRRNRKFLRLSTYRAQSAARPKATAVSHDTDIGLNIPTPKTQATPQPAEKELGSPKPQSPQAASRPPATPKPTAQPVSHKTPVQTEPTCTKTRSGRQVKAPQRLNL